MASTAKKSESITSEPIIINQTDVETPSTNTSAPKELETKQQNEEETLTSRLTKLVEVLEAQNMNNSAKIPPASRGRQREYRRRSPSFRPRSRTPSPIKPLLISNTKTLSNILSTTDTLAEINSITDIYNRTRHMIYITNIPFCTPELESFAWVLKSGILDTWIQKPIDIGSVRRVARYEQDLPTRGGRRHESCYVDDRYIDREERGAVAIARLGSALSLLAPKRSGEEDGEEELASGEERVKFFVIVQGKGNAGWVKLLVSYSRQAALVDIFHEMLNGSSIVFVGAVLKSVKLPIMEQRFEEVKFERAGSVEEAENVDEGTIGVIC